MVEKMADLKDQTTVELLAILLVHSLVVMSVESMGTMMVALMEMM